MLTLLVLSLLATPWQTDLFLPGTDTWHTRVAVEVTNRSADDLAGYPILLDIERLGLVGTEAAGLRVCDEAGTELLYDLFDPHGERLLDGPIPAGSHLQAPVAAGAGTTSTLWVYADNPTAYSIPDHLNAVTGVANPGFEQGQGEQPAGWFRRAADPTHTMRRVAAQPHSGRWCARMDSTGVAVWMTISQEGLRVVPGRTYRFTVQVRAQDVVGKAGWFVHLATAENPQAVGRVESAGDGTYDWRTLTFEVTAPPGATTLRHGSILYGSGTAWYDDVKLEELGAGPVVEVKVGQPERLQLQSLDGSPEYPQVEGHRYETRQPLHVVNVSDQPLQGVMVQTSLRRLMGLQHDGYRLETLRVRDPVERTWLPHFILGDSLLFKVDVPPRSRRLYQACLSRDPQMPAAPAISPAQLPGNLLANPSFEAGDRLPTGWVPMAEGAQGVVSTMTRVKGGVDGDWCGKLTMPDGAPTHWTGWSQELPVEPNQRYLLLGWVKTDHVTGRVRIHAHLLEGDGPTAPKRFWSGGPDLSGTTDWTLLGGVLATDAKTKRLIVYPTANVHGTIYHDGFLLIPMAAAAPGTEVEHRVQAGLPWHVWTENTLVKVFRDSPPRPQPKQLDLFAGRGEEEALQLCLRADQALTATVAVTREDGQSLPVRVERVGDVPCLCPSGNHNTTAAPWELAKPGARERCDGWRGWWPDYLAPSDGTFELPAGRTQPVWITFTIPRGTPPGEQHYQVEVTAGARTIRLPLKLSIWHLTLPERPSLQALIDLRERPNWSQFDTPEKRNEWLTFLARHRISADHILPDPVFTLTDGQVTMDTTAFDLAASFWFDELKLATGYFPQCFYAFGWEHSPRSFLGQKFPSPEYQSAYQQAVKLFWEHVQAKGWAPYLSLYVSDEPHYQYDHVVSELSEVIRLTRDVDPTIPVYSSTWGHEPAWDGLLNHWGIAQYGRFPLEDLLARQQAGDKLWLTVDEQLILDTPYNAYERLLSYYCAAWKLSGWEFWALAWYTYDPYRYGWYGFLPHDFGPDRQSNVRYPNGSGHLAYPGEPIGLSGPVSTIRLETMREGLEDYEIFHALRELAEQDQAAKAKVDALFSDLEKLVPIPGQLGYRSTEMLPDPDVVPAFRQRAGELLEALTK